MLIFYENFADKTLQCILDIDFKLVGVCSLSKFFWVWRCW